MNIEQQLKETQAKQQELVDRINALAEERQMLLEEVLRLGGEIRLLRKMKADMADAKRKPKDTTS